MLDAKEKKPQKNNQPKEYHPNFFIPPVGIAGIAAAFVAYRQANEQPTEKPNDKDIQLKQF